jgi:hypothetical protein
VLWNFATDLLILTRDLLSHDAPRNGPETARVSDSCSLHLPMLAGDVGWFSSNPMAKHPGTCHILDLDRIGNHTYD